MNGLVESLAGFERSLRVLRGLKEVTVQEYSPKVKIFLEWVGANRQKQSPTDIARQDIEAYLEHCFYLGNKNSTRLGKLIAIRNFFKYLVDEEKIEKDISIKIPLPKINKGRVQKYTKEEILKFFSAISPQTEKGVRDIAIFILGAFCGLRISEIINLSLYDIIEKRGKDGTFKGIDIEIIKTKFDANRTIALWKAPAEHIMKWIAIRISQGAAKDSPVIISYRKADNQQDRRITNGGLDKLIKVYATVAGIRKRVVKMHMLRATHTCDLRHIKKYDAFAIAERLGHKNIATTAIYIESWGRISVEHESLAAYWSEFKHLWEDKQN